MVAKRRQDQDAEGGLPGQPSAPPTHSSPRATPSAAPDENKDVVAPTAEEQEERVEKDTGDLPADVERERDEYLELARRTKADFDNYRKRVAGEARAAERRGRAELARELLPVLDNLERALELNEAARRQADERVDLGSLGEGVRLVHEELKGILKRSGVESYEPTGDQFDPHLHEAMMTRPAGDAEAGKVLEVVEKGYRLDGQVLRPARVIVGESSERSQDHR